jgi:hypothetical protein
MLQDSNRKMMMVHPKADDGKSIRRRKAASDLVIYTHCRLSHEALSFWSRFAHGHKLHSQCTDVATIVC